MSCSVYVLEQVDTGLIKIGMSGDPEKRARTFASATGLGMSHVYSRGFKARSDSRLVEQHIHKIYEDNRVGGEWFKGLNIDELVKFVKGINVAALRPKLKPVPASKPENRERRGDRFAHSYLGVEWEVRKINGDDLTKDDIVLNGLWDRGYIDRETALTQLVVMLENGIKRDQLSVASAREELSGAQYKRVAKAARASPQAAHEALEESLREHEAPKPALEAKQ